MIFNLVYASTAVKPFARGELVELLHQSQKKNAVNGITGLLLYKDGSFMQALEGDEDAVRDLYDTISADRRHHQVRTLLKITVEKRQFPDWLMGFKDLGEEGGTSPAGYKPLEELPPWVDILPWRASVALKLLAQFNERK